MTNKSSSKGWIVRVATKCAGGYPSVQIYDVAIADAAGAVRAVRQTSGADPGAVIETVAELPSGTALRDGEVLLR
jgi:hypothetical protein